MSNIDCSPVVFLFHLWYFEIYIFFFIIIFLYVLPSACILPDQKLAWQSRTVLSLHRPLRWLFTACAGGFSLTAAFPVWELEKVQVAGNVLYLFQRNLGGAIQAETMKS